YMDGLMEQENSISDNSISGNSTEGTPDPVVPGQGGTEPDAPQPEAPEPETQDTQKEYQEIMERLDLLDGSGSTEGITQRLDALIDLMSLEEGEPEAYSSVSFPFPEYTSWSYPISVDYTIWRKNSGSAADENKQYSTAQEFRYDYEMNADLCGSGGTLREYYVRCIRDRGGALLYDYQAVELIDVPFEGYEGWSYPIKVEAVIYPWGLGREMTDTQSYRTPEAFQEGYSEYVADCAGGGALKDYSIHYIYDSGGALLYDYEAGTQEPDPGDEETKETVQQLLTCLENINGTLTGITEADTEYYQAVADYREEMLQLQAADTAGTILLCVAMFAVFADLLITQLFGRMK
ncbi:MAG: hypothetical protein NC489_46800, partial [Ruminococcus flavefaciens]|nr:hypothetical protein [Ruminococcus flavefaciens]